jgi:hypothetical protein
LCNAYLQKTHTAVALTNLVIVGSYLGALTRIETKAILQTHSLDARINACSPYVEGCRKAIRDFDPSKRPLLIDRRKKDLPHALKKSSYKLVVYTAGALRVLTAEEAALRLREIAGGKTNYKESTKLEAHVQKTIEGLSKRLQQKPRAATLSLEALRTPHLAKKALRSIFT